MESKPKRLLALMISLFTALMCFVPMTVCAVENKGASGMSWNIRSVTAAPGSDVCVNVVAKNPAALRYVKNVTVISDSRLQPIGMTEYSEALNATFTYSIKGTQINFSMSSSSPRVCTNGSIIFSFYYHVPEGARDNDSYKIEWVASNCYAEGTNGAEYKIANFGSGNVNVSSSVPAGTTYTPHQPIVTTTSATPVTDPVTEPVTEPVTDPVTQPVTDPVPELIVDTPSSSELVEGKTVSLSVRSSTGAAVNGIWSESSDWGAVSTNGTNITLNKAGTYYVTVHGTVNGNQVSKKIAVTIQPKPTEPVTEPVTDPVTEPETDPVTEPEPELIVDQPSSDQLYVGNKVALNIHSSNGEAIGSKMITVSDSSAITSESNVLTLKKAGTYTVSVKASIGGKVYSKSITLTIIRKNEPVTEPVTDPVTDPVTQPVTDPVTEPVTDPVTDPVTEPATDPEEYKLGDVDNSGRYTVSDATLVLRQCAYYANPNGDIEPVFTSDKQFNAADTNSDKRLTTTDATRILRFICFLNNPKYQASPTQEIIDMKRDMRKWIANGMIN